MSKSKPFQELNLVDGFLFGASTENPEDAEYIAKLIIERATGKKVREVSVTQEKPLLGVDVGYHGIRMDLYVAEYEKEQVAQVYDIEPNRYGIAELPRRSRFSQALTDAKLLKAGKSYNDMPEYLVLYSSSVYRPSPRSVCYTIGDTVDCSHLPTTRWFKKGYNHSLFVYLLIS